MACCVVSYWIDTLVLKTEGNTCAPLLHHPFLFKGKTNASSRGGTRHLQPLLLLGGAGCSCPHRRVHSRLPESEVRAARRARQTAAWTGSSQSGCRSCRFGSKPFPPADSNDDILRDINHLSFTSVETDAHRRRCHKNAMELLIGIEVSEHLAKEKMVASAEAACLTKEHARAAQRLVGIRSSPLSTAAQPSMTRSTIHRLTPMMKIQPPLQEPKGKAVDEEPVKSGAPSSTLIYFRMNFVNMLCYVR